MARPNKFGLDYFSLDVDMDDKIELIEARYGIEGFGIVIKLFQKIYKNGYYLTVNEELLLLTAKRIGVNVKLITDVIASCVQYNIFDNAIFDEYNIITSSGIQKRFLAAVGRRKMVEMYQELVIADISEVNVHINSINACNNTQSKVNKSKVNKSKVKHNNSTERVSANKKITFSMFDNFWKIYPRKVNKGTAKKAWEKLCNKEGKDKPTWKEVRKAMHEQCKTKQWQDEKYIKHPATWLNSYSWLNDVSEMNKDFPILIHGTNIDKPSSGVPENPYNDPTLTMEEKKKIFFADVKEYTENWKKRGEKPQICGVNASLPYSWEEEAFVIWERENATYLKYKENEYNENKDL